MPRFKAMTTTVDGRRYRSQLEARWATLFNLLGWPFEYEPFQLLGWVPDFLLLGSEPVLVEVKPVYTFPPFVVEKVELARPPHEVLILGCTLPATPMARPGVISPRVLGWLAERSGDDDHTHLWWGDAILGERPDGRAGFRHREGSGFDRISGDPLEPGEPGAVAELWAEAGNRTQWGMR
jgi:hypothetical protein